MRKDDNGITTYAGSTDYFLDLEKYYSPNLLQYTVELLQNTDVKKGNFGNFNQKIDYYGYHSYHLDNIVERNIDIFPIKHMATRKVKNPMTNKKEFQFQLAYI